MFCAYLYIALAAIVEVCTGSPKWLGTNKFLRTKSNTGGKFSQISLGLLCTRGIVFMHPYCGFSQRCQMVPKQTAKLWTARCRQFRSILRKDRVSIYGSIWMPFPSSVRGQDVICNALSVL